jgi:hypothetical protein
VRGGVKACENLEKLHKKMEWRLESEAGRWKMIVSGGEQSRGICSMFVRSLAVATARQGRRGLSFEIYMASG